MIAGTLGILFIGLMMTGGLVAVFDFKYRKVPDALWIPAALAGSYFYVTAPLTVQVYVLPFVGGSLILSSIVYLMFNAKGFGQADAIGIIVASLFPFLLIAAIVPAMIVSYLGIKLHKWGGAGVPVAGLIGALVVLWLGVYIIA